MFGKDVADGTLPYPNDPATFEGAKIDWNASGLDQPKASLERFRELAGRPTRRQGARFLAKRPCRGAARVATGASRGELQLR